MYNTPNVNGVGVHWGCSSTSITSYGVLVINSTSHTLKGDVETAADGTGYVTSHVTYNHNEEATIETWVSGSSASSTVAIATATCPQPGDKITIVDATNTIFSGSNWIVGNTSISRGNTTYAKISIPVTRFAKGS